MRGDDEHELVFKAHVLSDVTSSDSPPEVAVALRLVKRPDEIAVGGKPVFSGDSPVSSLHTVRVKRDVCPSLSSSLLSSRPPFLSDGWEFWALDPSFPPLRTRT